MKFRTEIEPLSYPFGICHRMRGVALGSCFAGNIGNRLRDAGFRLAVNPTGVMFNPISVARTLELLESAALLTQEDLVPGEGMLHSFDFHGSFSSVQPQEALRKMNEAIDQGHRALQAADYVIVTLGTAWVFELATGNCRESGPTVGDWPESGRVVANCHRFPANHFNRRLVTEAEIVDILGERLRTALPGKKIILTVSPVRHTADGLAGNSLSKAILRRAAALLCESVADCYYFPAFEIMIDDLRDYRFYDTDMRHPSAEGIEYIWEKFSDAFFDLATQRGAMAAEKITAAFSHRILDQDAASREQFARTMINKITELQETVPGIDFQRQQDYFNGIIGDQHGPE